MKLLVILLCLFSERFLVHGISHDRFSWFKAYQYFINSRLSKHSMRYSVINWVLIIIPLVLLTLLLKIFLESLFWGLAGFFFHLFIFFYCLGPDNPFYPPAAELLNRGNDPVKPYFSNVNSQLFTPIFWYLILGPVGLVFYRLNSIAEKDTAYNKILESTTALFEWIPARLTALTYLLAGHFQKGMPAFKHSMFAGLKENDLILSETGMSACVENNGPLSLPQAEALVEQALVIYMVGCAIVTIALWL